MLWVQEILCEMFLCLGNITALSGDGLLFAEAKAAPNICFTEVNSKGDRFGNCGFHGHDYKKCSSW